MNFFKNFAVVMGVVLCLTSLVCSAQQNPDINRDESGAYVYETRISSLVERELYEGIKIINNSSYPIAYVTCKIVIKGKEHAMRPIPVLKVSDTKSFEGYYGNDMKKEIPKYFKKYGKISQKNNISVKFVLQFKENTDKVAVTDIYDKEKDLCFIVSDLEDRY